MINAECRHVKKENFQVQNERLENLFIMSTRPDSNLKLDFVAFLIELNKIWKKLMKT